MQTSTVLASIAQRIYPHWNPGGEFWDYRPIIGILGKELAKSFSEDLDGFCFVAYDGGSEIGILEFAFGCCKGCDRLNACESYEEVDFLIDQMRQSIQWYKRHQLAASLMQYKARLLIPEQLAVFEEFSRKLLRQ